MTDTCKRCGQPVVQGHGPTYGSPQGKLCQRCTSSMLKQESAVRCPACGADEIDEDVILVDQTSGAGKEERTYKCRLCKAKITITLCKDFEPPFWWRS